MHGTCLSALVLSARGLLDFCASSLTGSIRATRTNSSCSGLCHGPLKKSKCPLLTLSQLRRVIGGGLGMCDAACCLICFPTDSLSLVDDTLT